jgi:DNA-binding Xre family transcriptional regulator
MIRLRLAEFLREKNKSLYWLAKTSGVSYQTVHALSKGRPVKRLDMEVLEKLARALGREAGELLEMKEGGVSHE